MPVKTEDLSLGIQTNFEAWRTVYEQFIDLRNFGGKLVVACGCFDVLHLGHIRLLQEARKLGNALVVGINSDASARTLKVGRPIFPSVARREMLRALRCVDDVVIFDEPTPERVLYYFRPDIYVKGGDYTPDQVPEACVIDSWGGELKILKHHDGYSTSDILLKLSIQ